MARWDNSQENSGAPLLFSQTEVVIDVENTEPVFVNLSCKEPRNRIPAWRAVTATLFNLPARLAQWAGDIDFLKSIPGLLQRLQIRALGSNSSLLNAGVRRAANRPLFYSGLRRAFLDKITNGYFVLKAKRATH